MSELGDKLNIVDSVGATLVKGAGVDEALHITGKYTAECYDKDGNFKWRAETPNVVATVGKNQMLDQALAGAAYTVTGPFMGLISLASFSAIVAADTMASHAGWLEAGVANAPTYTIPRKTAAWSVASAGAKALSAALAFTFTGAGTVKGAFMVFGAGALSTVDNTAGTLFSAALFTGGDKTVVNTDIVNVTYSVSL